MGNTQPFKHKFDQRVYKCIFFGHVTGQKAYRAFDINSNKLLIFRDVIFHEDIFLYQYINQESFTHVSLSLCPRDLTMSNTFISLHHVVPDTEDDNDLSSTFQPSNIAPSINTTSPQQTINSNVLNTVISPYISHILDDNISSQRPSSIEISPSISSISHPNQHKASTRPRKKPS